jgi:hypothetical protein
MSIKIFNKLPNEIKILIHNTKNLKKLEGFFAVLFFLCNTGILQSSK